MNIHFPFLIDGLPCFTGQDRRVENSTPFIKCYHCTSCLLQAWDLLRGKVLAQSPGRAFPRTIAPRGISSGTEVLSYIALSLVVLWAKRKLNKQL